MWLLLAITGSREVQVYKLERRGPGRGKGGREGRGEKRERGIEGSKVTVLQFKCKHAPSIGVISTLVGGENFADHRSKMYVMVARLGNIVSNCEVEHAGQHGQELDRTQSLQLIKS